MLKTLTIHADHQNSVPCRRCLTASSNNHSTALKRALTTPKGLLAFSSSQQQKLYLTRVDANTVLNHFMIKKVKTPPTISYFENLAYSFTLRSSCRTLRKRSECSVFYSKQTRVPSKNTMTNLPRNGLHKRLIGSMKTVGALVNPNGNAEYSELP